MNSRNGRRAALLPLTLLFAAGCSADPPRPIQGHPVEAHLAWAPVMVVLLFICGLFVAVILGLTALLRKSPAAGGALVALLGTGFLAGALLLFGYACVSVPAPPTAVRVETYPAPPPPGPMHPMPAVRPLPPMPPRPPRHEALPLPLRQGVTRIVPVEEIPVAGSPAPVAPSFAPVEAPRPVDPAEATAAVPTTPPDWVRDGGSVRDGDRTLVVVSGEQFADAATAWRDAASRAADLIRRDFEQFFRPTGRWRFDPQRVNAIRNSFTEEIRRSAGENEFTVYRTYLQVELSPAVRHQIEPVWREQVSRQRSGIVAVLFAALTAAAATLAGFFRLDARTGGRYRGRLKLGTFVALATALATAVAVARTTADPARRPAAGPPAVHRHVPPPHARKPHLKASLGGRDPERFRDVADRMVEAINAADYDGVRRDFNKPMRDAFPVEKCGVFFDAEISRRFGRIDGLEPPQLTSPSTATFVAHCERGTLDFTLSLDERGQVSGMLFRPRLGGTS